jgi:diguanylate cyclase (GGDEF)-like protein
MVKAETPKNEFSALTISARDQTFSLDNSLYYYEDLSGELGVNDVLELPASQWRLPEQTVPSFGLNDSPHWFSISIRNKLEVTSGFYLHIAYAALDHIEVYNYVGDQPRTSYIAGDSYPFEERNVAFPTFLFPIDMAPEQNARILFRVQTKGSMLVPTSIWLKEPFLAQKQKQLLLYGLFVGILLIMSIYNLFLFVSIKDKSYFFYSAFTLSFLGLNISIDGFAYQWLWPESPNWQQFSILFFGAMSSLTLSLFARYFLPITADSRMRYWLNCLVGLCLANFAATLVLPYHSAALLQSLVSIAVIIGTVSAAALLSKRSQSLATLFLVSWFIFFIGVLFNVSNKLGFIPYSLFSEYGSMAGAIIGLLMLSLALANRINLERREKNVAKHDAINHLSRFRSLYEHSVEGIFILKSDTAVIEANPRFLQLTQCSAKQITGAMFLDFFTSPARANDFFSALNGDKPIINFEAQLQCPTMQKDHSPSTPNWVSISAQRVTTEDSSDANIEGSFVNISERKAFESKLTNLALHDPLTGDLNRRTLENIIKELLSSASSDESSGIFHIDIDQFKVINDLCGHTAGDSLLKATSGIINQALNESGALFRMARLGGDEFCAFVQGLNKTELKALAEKIRTLIDEYMFEWKEKSYHVECSIGLLLVLGPQGKISDLLSKAESACENAKKGGRNRVYFFLEKDTSTLQKREEIKWIAIVRDAIKNDYFQLQIQAITPCTEALNKQLNADEKQKIPPHFEVLIRLNLPNDESSSPNAFLPAAERFGLMPQIDRWVVTNLFKWLTDNPEECEALECASINLSMQSIGDHEFHTFLAEQFKTTGIPPEKICLEFTESVAMTHIENTRAFIDEFKAIGCRLALDDFGTGFSSYAYLKDLNVDYVKIDGVFIHNIADNPVDYTMVKSIQEVANAMGIETVAEYVEDTQTIEALSGIGIDYVQGYYVHKPEPLV